MDLRHGCPVETWRLLWIMALMLAVIITFQYFELPHGNNMSSSISNAVLGNGSLSSDDESANLPIMTPFTGLNSSSPYDDVNNDLESEGMIDFNDSSGEASPEVLVDSKVNSTISLVNSLDSRPKPEETDQIISQETSTSDGGNSPVVLALQPIDLSPNITLLRNVESIIVSPGAAVDSTVSATERDKAPSFYNNGTLRDLQKNITTLHKKKVRKKHEETPRPVISISEMYNLLFQSLSSPNMMRPRWPSSVDQELLHIKAQIENSPIINNDPMLYPPLYKNISMFKRSYELMEEFLKVYIYREGERPILHQPFFQGLYASEGWFMKQLEDNKRFVTKNPAKAHLFYLPFSSRNLEEALYVPDSHSHKNLIAYLKDYLDMISAKYPFWNRTEGADHFLVACHDWAPSETRRHMANCIRALCNSDVYEGFVFGKDVSLPETYVRKPRYPLRDIGGKRPSKRSILAFFAGSMHGHLREILLQQWVDKDPDMKIYGPEVRGKINYVQYMKRSKYCICAKGYEVNSPRVVEAIVYECVPVIISDNFVPPFLEVLNWESFAVFVPEKEIANLKNILLSIPKKRFRSMQMRVKKVQQHFLWHLTPVKYDIFHMILHSIWFNRVFRMQTNIA